MVLLIVAVRACQVLDHTKENLERSALTRWENTEFQTEVLLSDAFDAHSDLAEDIEFEATSVEEQFKELLERASDQ